MAKSKPTRPLADVNVLPQPDGSHEIVVCFQADPEILVGEGQSKAILALDASRSLMKMYGFGGPFGGDPNYVQAVGRKLGAILCSAAKSGKSSAFYWALGNGDGVEPIGEFDEAGWATVPVIGPKDKKQFGRGTKLLPAIRRCVDHAGADADLTIGAIITDGIIEDEQDCVGYCLAIGREMADGKRKPVKLVLIGIGQEVDEGQLERFDDMFEGTDLEGKVDVWSSGLVASMQDEADIMGVLYGELIGEDVTVAASGRVEDGSGRQVASFADGLPGKFRFELPKGQTSFTIHAGGQQVKQDVSDAIGRA